DVRQLGAVLATVAVDDVTADAPPREDGGRALGGRRKARIRLPGEATHVRDDRGGFALGDDTRWLAKAGRDHLGIAKVARDPLRPARGRQLTEGLHDATLRRRAIALTRTR